MPDVMFIDKQDSRSLSDDVFNTSFNEGLLHECVRAELAARRRGTASTKTRGQVSGGGSKPWRQKGTGRARAGSTRSPIWVGGGTIFGPTPRSYTVKVNRKARQKALAVALSWHAQHASIKLLAGVGLDQPSTKTAQELLKDSGLGLPVLVVVSAEDVNIAKSFRNIEGVTVLNVEQVGVSDLVSASGVLLVDAALEDLTARAAGSSRRNGNGTGA